MNTRNLQLLCAGLAMMFAWPAQRSCAAPAPLPGVIWKASDGRRTVRFITPTPHFVLEEKQSLHPQLLPAFTAECEGLLKVPQAGAYTIHAGVPVWIDGVEVANRRVTLRAGDLPIRLTFQRAPGRAKLSLLWESDDFAPEPVPDRAFAHREEPTELATHEKSIRGRELIEEFHCTKCHPTGNSILTPRGAPDLSDSGGRLRPAWVFNWLENPVHFRTNAAMPALLRSAQERADVAAYLSTLREPPPATRPKQSQAGAPSAEAGSRLFAHVGCAACHGETGVGLDGIGSKFAEGRLARYLENSLDHRAGTRMPDMFLTAAEAESLALFLGERRRSDFEQPTPAGSIERGRELVVSRGCAACHVVREVGNAVANRLSAPPLESLDPQRGCLAEAPPAGAPRFGFAAADREALRRFLRSPDVSEAPLADLPRLVARFRCQSCHEFHGPATYDSGANPPPPSLGDIGGKLRPEWLEQVLHAKKRARPWLELRMPHYGAGTLEAVARGFAAVTAVGAPPVETRASFAQVRAGAQLIGAGEGGLSCVTCHDCLGAKSIGDLRGPDLAGALQRSRSDWVRRWLREPQRIAPGTAMPAFFSALTSDEREEKIDRILAALSAGANMPPPVGLRETTSDYLLAVGEKPLVLRCFLVGSSARSIAVGLPGGVSYCFDAESCRLRFAWSGEFLDMTPVWAGRGGMPPRLRGPKFFTAPGLFPLRTGPQPVAPKFRGHAIVNGLPEFYFNLGDIAVTQRIAMEAGGGLVCTFDLRGMNGDLSCHVPPNARLRAAGKFHIPGPDGWAKIPENARAHFELLISGPETAGPVKTAANTSTPH
jgi:mono/diheme cytochrome c family protein